MKRLAYYLLATGETPFEKFLKSDSYLAIFVAWAMLGVGCISLFYGGEIYDYLVVDLFRCDCNVKYDEGRAMVFRASSIIFFIIGTLASIYKAYRISKK